VKYANLTIVTNEYLENLVKKWGGKGYVLQDKIPDLNPQKKVRLEGEINIVYISSFGEDEPIKEVIEAAKMIKPEWIIFITGNYKGIKNTDFLSEVPNNIKLTGFLDEIDYQNLLFSSDLVIVLTKQEYTLTCGAYEAVALKKPLIISDTRTLRNYFNKGVVYTKNDFRSIAMSVKYAIANKRQLSSEIHVLKDELEIKWNKRFKELNKKIQELFSFSE
jgi:glycosyltransferase involved in cell wall biosynthesis